MLLFGGNLTGATRAARGGHGHGDGRAHGEATVTAAAVAGAPEASDGETPHTDALHRLTNHELRLLEELERTRAKLQAEWRLKLEMLPRDGPETNATLLLLERHRAGGSGLDREDDDTAPLASPSVAMQSQSDPPCLGKPGGSIVASRKPFLPHKNPRSRAAMASSSSSCRSPLTANHEAVLPKLRTRLDMLPILTTSGETPFEVGLVAPSPEASVSSLSGSSHVLPVFRLPTVSNVTATASALAVKQADALAEDKARRQASEALGLSLTEIERMEAELRGERVPSSPQQKEEAEEMDSPQAGRAQVQRAARRALPQQQHRRMKRKPINRRSAAAGSCEPGEGLRHELVAALHNVQHLTRLVKHDMLSAQKICPTSELRNSLYFKRWGREKVEGIFRRLLYNLQGLAFARWKQHVDDEIQQEKRQIYLLYKGSKQLDAFLRAWQQRQVRHAWTTWCAGVARVRASERSALELDAIRVLQRAYRGFRGRVFTTLIRRQRLHARQSEAATRLQRAFRANMARRLLRLLRRDRDRQRAATCIQARVRGMHVRNHVRRLALARRQHRAASRVQAMFRRRQARRQVAAMLRLARVTRAARLIQRRYRGRLGRAQYLRQRIERYRAQAAGKIQRMARTWRGRRVRRALRLAQQELLARHMAAATTIQRVYRGHRARLGTQLKLLALRETNRKRAQAATRIQTLVRARQARHRVLDLRAARLADLIALARRCVECWDEDAAQWFYYCEETGEALWAPPCTGYTKADGMLVLQSGNVVPDPGDVAPGADTSAAFHARRKHKSNGDDPEEGTTMEEEEETKRRGEKAHAEEEEEDDQLCVECEEEDALRRCAQCEDVFCDACFERLHSSSKREKHTWTSVGTLRCIECEKMRATRWCHECQDPYCLGCFTIIHTKGNKAGHQWVSMAAFKKQQKQQLLLPYGEEEDAQTYDEFTRTNEYQYVTQLATEEAVADEWATLYDETAGQYYYYNSTTGESQWVPY